MLLLLLFCFSFRPSPGTEIGLRIRLDKCGAYSRDGVSAATVARSLHIPHWLDGYVAAGNPIGSDEFVRTHAESVADTSCALVDDLLGLPLGAQDQFLLLRRSLQLRTAHLP